jgi:hypothetical protein
MATGCSTGRSRFDPWQRWKDFSSSLCVQIGSGAHPASCTMRTEGPFPGVKARPGRDADHSPHLVPRSRMSRSYAFSPFQAPSRHVVGQIFSLSVKWCSYHTSFSQSHDLEPHVTSHEGSAWQRLKCAALFATGMLQLLTTGLRSVASDNPQCHGLLT